MELSLGRGGCSSRVERTPSESRESFSAQSTGSSRSLSAFSHSANLKAHKKKHDILAKVILLGESTVGKSCLTNRYVMGEFDFNCIATVGMDIRIKNMDMDGKALKLQIWDTAGQERYRGITKAFHRGANGVMFIYDITNKESFQKLKTWIQEFEKSTTAQEPVPMVVVGNKVDLNSERMVGTQEAREWCEYWEIPYFETSARTGDGVCPAFENIARRAALHSVKRSKEKGKTLVTEPRKKRCSQNCVIS